MNDETHPDTSETGNGSLKEFSELRRILLEPEHDQLNRTDERLRKLEERKVDMSVGQVSDLLPQAIVHRSRKDQKLANALAPTIEKTIQVSVRRDPRPIVDAIFPIIGPAIRKSISEALSSTLESVNQTMEHRFSLKAMRWRLEARRTGRSFSEVAMSHTLLYRIEQIFMIDRTTGVPLAHVTADAVNAHDGSIVSSMLTAIQDFVQDSFGSEEDEVLETLEVGDMNVWFESGPYATVAAVIRGMPPRSLRDHLKELVEVFHLNYSDDLVAFDGDVDPFQGSVALLTSGLLEQKQEREKRPSLLLWFVLIALACLLGWLIYRGVGIRNAKSSFLSTLDSRPGIVVTDTFVRNGFLHVSGLRDPLAESLDGLASESGMDPERIVYNWEQYQTLAPEIVRARATTLLNPPASVDLKVSDGIVYSSGVAPTQWIDSAIASARYLSPSISYDDAAVVHQEDLAIADARENIEALWIGFAFGSADIPVADIERIDRLAGQVALLSEAADIRGVTFKLIIWGGASGNADTTPNRLLMDARSNSVRRALVTRGVDASWLVSTPKSEAAHFGDQDEERARSVELQVEIMTDS